ncbi:IS5 family transposase [Glycomyces sp. NRRL B-16210]|uniref:IS5 family transposase n=1 Tax=Glycomyces sp. NRRL B-16210 TaxID=1463821 RepID=UPI0004BF0DBB|nr:IS5 family transposase [Glycomyces sp. NRRL B-16210]
MTSERPAYPSDLSDQRWALIEPIVSAWRAERAEASIGINGPVHDLRRIVDAILYINRTGAQWRYLPHDFAPRQTVYSYYAAWEKEGVTAQIHEALRTARRHQAKRSPRPHAAIADAQSVKTSANVPEADQGIDAGKKIKGRKRHIVTDFLGLLLAVVITAASVSDTAGGRDLVDIVAVEHPSVATLLVGNGYQRSVIERGEAAGIDVVVTQKPNGVKGFQPTARWAVERTFGWFTQHRRLVRDYETLPERAETQIHWSMIDLMSKHLTGQSAPSRRPPTQTDDSP